MTFNLKNKSFAIFISTLLLFCTSSLLAQPCGNTAPPGQTVQCSGTCSLPGTTCQSVAYPSIGVTCDCLPSPSSSITPTPSVSPTPSLPQYVDIVSCSRTTAGLCTQIDAACSYRNTSTNQVFNGKCKNETINGLTFCRCSVIENTAEGCTQWITDPIAGRCYEQNQQCTIQGSSSGGRTGTCTNRAVTSSSGQTIWTCSCQPPRFEDIVPCSRTSAGLCSQIDAACSYRDNSNGQVFNGKCKNLVSSSGGQICICDITEDTAEGCKHFIGGPIVGACYAPNQECTYQGSGPDDPDRGSRGVCVTRTEIDVDSNNQVLRCRCNERAVCGDDRVDTAQGEACDPPGIGSCGVGEFCTFDCKYCLPLDSCFQYSGNESACTSARCYSSGIQTNCVYNEETQACSCPVIF